MKFIVEIKNNRLFINEKEEDFSKERCLFFGNIYNINAFDSSSANIEDKVLKLYEENPKILKELNGEYIIIILSHGKIKLIRDKMGSKNIYYAFLKKQFICTNELKTIIEKYKECLEIDKEALGCYLRYLYIAAPRTIFKNVYKVREGEIVEIVDYQIPIIKRKKYYDLIKEYKKLKNKERNYKKARENIKEKLEEAVKVRAQNQKKIGVYFSAGIDSTLIASLAKKQNFDVHTYTIGFYEKERNEADKAKKIASYLKTNHHEYYLSREKAKEIIKTSVQIYSEPFADPSLIPTIFLNEQVDKDVDVVLTGDGADQLFLGSEISVYYYSSIKSIFKKDHALRTTLSLKLGGLKKAYRGYEVSKNFIEEIPPLYIEPIKERIKQSYMLMDILYFLSNRLMSKVSFPASYYHITLTHPFNDDEVVKEALKLKYSFKRRKGIKKYIVKDILYDFIPKELLNETKSGFGIPLENWVQEIFKEDILKFSKLDILEKQGLFSNTKITIIMNKLERNEINRRESYVLFAYYIFQLWYQEYMEDLWI